MERVRRGGECPRSRTVTSRTTHVAARYDPDHRPVIAIGASIGGTRAISLAVLPPMLRESFAQHMPETFTASFAGGSTRTAASMSAKPTTATASSQARPVAPGNHHSGRAQSGGLDTS